MLTLDTIAYNSPIRGLSPKAKIAFGAIPLILCLCFRSFLVDGIIIAVMAVSAVKVSKLPLKRYFKLLFIPFSFLLIGTITIVIGRYPEGAELLLGINISHHAYGVTPASLREGGVIILTAIAAISCMFFVTINTPMNDILAVLRSVHVPALLISLMELIYRYIFVILEEAARMRLAQDSRLGYTSFRRSIRSFGELAGSLFLRAYMRSDRIYSALEARGYDGDFRTFKPEFLHSRKLIILGMLLNACLLAAAVLEKLI